MATLLDYIGGKLHAGKLLKLLEVLLVIDEISVRNEALITFKIILSQINPSDLETEIMDLINRLSSSEYIHQKQTAIPIIPLVLKGFNNNNRLSLTK